MRLLVGLDLGVGHFSWLLRRAEAFAEAFKAQLDLVYVTDDDKHLATLEELMQTIAEPRRGKAFITHGDPEERLVELTRDYDAIVVGPHEPENLERFTKGAMAVRILRRSRCPVYVPRGDAFGDGPLRFVVGVDLHSDRRDYVIERAAFWARSAGASLDAIHSIPRSLPPIRRPDMIEAAQREWTQLHEPALEQLRELVTAATEGMVKGEVSITHTEPEDALVEAGENASLLIVGNRERRGLSRLLLGGVARHVVRSATTDVLVLPTATLD